MLEFLRRRAASSAVVERAEPVLQAPPVTAVSNAVSLTDLLSAADVFLPNAPGVATPIVNARTAMRVGAVYACARILAGGDCLFPAGGSGCGWRDCHRWGGEPAGGAPK